MSSGRFSISESKLLVCLGPGGVGKTTLSAAFAVLGVMERRAVDVMTVDPAPRLLDALGLDPSNPAPQSVALNGIATGARLRALKLDPKATFDKLVERYAASDAARDRILSNRIYRNLSNALAGVGDYMAIERLLELHLDPATELIVLDTPPSKEALDFLDAPRRLLELLNSRAITLLGGSRRLMRSRLTLVDIAARAVLSAFDRLTGLRLLSDVQTFVENFDGMYEGFADRARRAQELLRAEGTAAIVVTTPEAARIEQAHDFVRALDTAGLAVRALVVNRAMAAMPAASELERSALAPELKRKLKRNLKDYSALKEREEKSLAALRKILPRSAHLLTVPDLGYEPRTLDDLAAIGRTLKAELSKVRVPS